MPRNAFDKVEYRYHAVGQGLFASGALRLNSHGPRFRWVYDCGTVSSQKLIDRELERLPWLHWHHDLLDPSKIELVTLSHFDADHISGFEKLLRRHRIGTLLLPFVPLASRILLAFLQGVAVTDPRFRLFLDPIGYILSIAERGEIERIIIVPPADGQPVPEPPETAAEPREPSFELSADTEDGAALSESDALLDAPQRSGTSVEMLKPGGRLHLANLWEFVPYNDGGVQPADWTHFQDEVTRLKSDIMEAAEALRNGADVGKDLKSAIAILKAYYDDQMGGGSIARNIISLFVYSGPLIERVPSPWNRSTFGHGSFADKSSERLAQLFTGDGYLDTEVRFQAMARHFGQTRMKRVGILQVMHHGARSNWHSGLAEKLNPDISIFSANPKSKSPGHPHAEVLRDFWQYCPVRVDCDADFSVTAYLSR